MSGWDASIEKDLELHRVLGMPLDESARSMIAGHLQVDIDSAKTIEGQGCDVPFLEFAGSPILLALC